MICTIQQIRNKIKKNEIGRSCSTYGTRKGASESERKNPLRMYKSGLKNNIKMSLQKKGFEVRIRFISLLIGTGVGVLRMR